MNWPRSSIPGVLVLVMALLGSCSDSETQRPTGLPSGAEPPSAQSFAELVRETKLSGVQFHWLSRDQIAYALVLEIESAQYQPTLYAAPLEGITAMDVLHQNQLTVVLGSGYTAHAESLEPVGLLTVAGQELSPLAPYGYTRILGFGPDQAEVVHRSDYDPDRFANALQLGPGIIEQGKLDISQQDLKRPRYYRSFAALCDHGWLVGLTITPSHLHTLGTDLLKLFAAQSMNCPEVVNFAGDRQAVIVIKTPEQVLYHGETHSPKASLLGFKPG